MRIVRFDHEGRVGWGRLEEGAIRVFSPPFPSTEETGEVLALAAVRLLAPAQATKIVCVGRNYLEHAQELGNALPPEPLIFLKPPSAVVGPGEAIRLPEGAGEVHHEAELAVVLGRRLSGPVDAATALEAVLGYACLNDVSARAIQRAEKSFTRAKGFDTFCPIGPWIETRLPASGVAVICRVDGEVRQAGNTAQMIFDVGRLLAFVAGVMTLEPGDVLATGTPAGVGPLFPGQTVEVEIEGIGVLTNPVVARPW